MDSLEVAVQTIVPQIYDANRIELGLPLNTDLSHGNRCDRLTLDAYQALTSRGLIVRRELHQDDDLWHYMLAHGPADAEPSATDIVTCLNPWQYVGAPRRLTGPLHGGRQAVQEILAANGAPEWFISLRSIDTITQSHTELRTPFMR